MESKTEKAVRLYKAGCIKESLTIFRTFRFGLTIHERRTLEIANDYLHGRGRLYEQIGIDCDKELDKCKSIIEKRFIVTKS